jgi:hypothetical protein
MPSEDGGVKQDTTALELWSDRVQYIKYRVGTLAPSIPR